MTEYSKIQKRVWNSRTFRRLSEDAKFLWFYILTCPHCNMVGMYVLKPGYVQEDLDWTNKRFQKAFDELLNIPTTNGNCGLVKYDVETRLIFIINFLEHNPLKNPNQTRAAVKKLKDLPYSPLFQDFKLLVKQLNKQSNKQIYDLLLEQLGKPVAVTVTVTEAVPVTEISVQDPEKGPGPVVKIPLKDNSDFNVTEELLKEFQESYPIQDVIQTMRDIRLWNISNKGRRKTRAGIMSHITSWLKRNHDKGKNMINGGGNESIYDRLIRESKETDAVVQQEGSHA